MIAEKNIETLLKERPTMSTAKTRYITFTPSFYRILPNNNFIFYTKACFVRESWFLFFFFLKLPIDTRTNKGPFVGISSHHQHWFWTTFPYCLHKGKHQRTYCILPFAFYHHFSSFYHYIIISLASLLVPKCHGIVNYGINVYICINYRSLIVGITSLNS